MDQTAQSSQADIALRSLQLKKEQIEAFFNQHRLMTGNSLADNQLSENVNPIANAQLQIDLNHQLNQQLLNHQLSQQFGLQMHPKCLSPEAPAQMSSIFNPPVPPGQLYPKDSDALKKRLGFFGQLSVEQLIASQLAVEGSQLAGTQFNNATKLAISEANAQFKFASLLNSPHSFKTMDIDRTQPVSQAPLPPRKRDSEFKPIATPPPVGTSLPSRPTNSAFKPVARRKDSVYSMDYRILAEGKRLAYNQQIIDLLKTKTSESTNSKLKDGEPSRRIKSPKKSYSLSRKSPTGQLAKHPSHMEQFNGSAFASPNQYSHATKLDLISSPKNSSASLNSSPFNSSLNHPHLPLNHSLNYSRDDQEDSLPLDMTNKAVKPKNEPDETHTTDRTAKRKLTKEADLGQYINKIISENAAIVEQNELRLPLTKRLNSRNSTSNMPSMQFKCKQAGQQPRMNRSISVIQPPVQLQRTYNELNQENMGRNLDRLASFRQTMMSAERDDRLKVDLLNQESPKLVSALRGQLESNETAKPPAVKQPTNLEANSALLNSPFFSLYQQSQQRKLSDGNYLQHPSQLDWENPVIKSYFNSKAPTIKVTPPSFSQGESSENPDNYSQSSIIKDLLLVSNKDAAAFQQSDKEKIYQNELQKQQPEDLKTGDQEELSCLVYVCTICNIAFRNKETLAAHQTHYCKNNQSNKDLYSEVSRLTGASKNGSADDLPKSDRSKDALGILKQHLLHPNSNCPLPKKRKISEPCFSSSSLNSHSLFANEAASFKAASTLDELNRPNSDLPKDSNAVYFSNFGLEAPGSNVARKISVLHPANKPYFITIKQPVFDHDHLIDLRQVPGQPAQLNNQLFAKSECNPKLLRSDHNNSVTNLTDLSQLQPLSASSPAATCVTQSPISRSPRITSSPVPLNKNSNHSSHKFIDQPKDYTLISEYLPHYERKVTVKGDLKFDILTKTLEEQGEQCEFKQSHEEETASNACYKINNQVRQISSMPEFIEKTNESNIKSESEQNVSKVQSTSAVIDLTESLRESEQSAGVNDNPTKNPQDSPVNSDKDKECDQSDKSVKNSEISYGEANCVTKRPASLFNCLPKKPSHLTCSTLVSPETPRSEKTFVQCYQNGQLYTYLTKKRSTRVTFCCIYRPQPMFIEQSIEPKLSMYSNWQIYPPYEEILQTHKAPVLMKMYDSRQWKHRLHHYTSKFTTKLVLEVDVSEHVDESSGRQSGDQLESREEPEESGDKNEAKESAAVDRRSLTDDYLQRLRQVDDRNGCLMLPAFNWMMQMLKQDRINIKIKLREFKKKFCEESSDLTDRLLKRRRKISRKISDEYSINSLDARQVSRKQSSTTNPPKRIYIFEGGFKSNEDYVYIRGKGKGKYVCAECGIRCKKPSMLRKHIRTHTDLRPYSCLHCSFAFKTKGNLTKHMKSKAHHKKCAELGISPVPTSIDTQTQIDSRALAIQEAMERASNQLSYMNDDCDDDMDDMLDDSDEMLNLMDDIDDDQLDLKYGIDEDDDLEEDDDEEEYMLRLNTGIDQHLHIICLRILSSNFSVNKNDPLVGLDTSNNYLGVNIGCLTNFKRLSAFSDIILPNATAMNETGKERLNKFSEIQDAFNSSKTNHNPFNSLTGCSVSAASKSFEDPPAVKPDGESADSQSVSQSAASRLFNQSESVSLDAVKAATDNAGLMINKSSDSGKTSSLINVLDNNNNLVTLSRARLGADDSMQPNPAIRHKHSLIGGVNSASLASIPECLEEECRREEEQPNFGSKTGRANEDSSAAHLDLDGNFEISRPVNEAAGAKFCGASSEPKRKLSKDEESAEEDCDRRKRQKNSNDNNDKSVSVSCASRTSDKASTERKESCSLEPKGDKSINNGDVSNNRADKADQTGSTSLVTSGMNMPNSANMSNRVTSAIAERSVKSEPDSDESTEERLDERTLKELHERTSTASDSKSTLTTGRRETTTTAKNVIESNAVKSYLSHHKKTTTVGGPATGDEKADKSKEELSKPDKSQAKRNDSSDSESSSDNECPSFSKESSTESSKKSSTENRPAMQLINLSQLSADAIPKLNLDHRCSSRPKSLPPPGFSLSQQPDESRSSSANSAKISEIDEHEVAHSLLSLARSQTTTPNPIILPLKRKISQGFGSVPYHHGNYYYIGDANNRTSPAISPLTTCSDEEVSRAFKKSCHNNSQNEKSWSSEEWKLTDKLTDRLKEEINRKFSEKGTSSSRKLGRLDMGRLSEDLSVSRLNSSTKLSEKLAEIKRTGLEDPLNLTKQLDDNNDDIQKLLQKVEHKTKSEEEIDQNKLISIYIQNKIDKHERILNDGTLNVNPTPSSFALNSTLNKQPAVDNCRMNICTICNKTFSEESSLRLHEHIHYFERPFRCAICQVSFRSTGHLQKHIRSGSHQNKLNQSTQFGQPSPTNPRPFKCSYCEISFRIFGHLSKHLRSKIHIGKLEGLGKLPPGLYSLMERNRIQLNDLDTTDCETNLQSLCKLAQRLQANGDLPIAPNLSAETYSPTSHSSFVCSSAYCESSNEDSNLSSGKSIDDKQSLALGYLSVGLSEGGSSNPGQLPNDLHKYAKIVTTNQMNQLALSQPIPLFSTASGLLPIDPKLKPIGLIPTHLIDNFAIYSGHYIPQQKFFDQQSCKHPHHLYPQALPRNEDDVESLPHGHPLPKAGPLKSDSPEINVLEDSNESSRSSARLEIELSDKEAKENAETDKVPNCKASECSSPQSSSPKPNSSSGLSSSKARSASPREDFASIQLVSNTCSICNQVFKSTKFLQVHLFEKKGMSKEEHLSTEKVEVKAKESDDLNCKICGKKLDDIEQLKSHAQVHSVARPFICEICDAGFSLKTSLDSHSKTHKS